MGDFYEKKGTDVKTHVYLDGLRIASLDNGNLQYYHTDHLGGVHLKTDDIGQVSDTVEYKPFGEFARHDGAIGGQEGRFYTDQYRDEESGLYYYNARYYNPKVGRFISSDWIVPDPEFSQAFNRYAYVYNNPVNFIDPTGNQSELPDGVEPANDKNLIYVFFRIIIKKQYNIGISEQKYTGINDSLRSSVANQALSSSLDDPIVTSVKTPSDIFAERLIESIRQTPSQALNDFHEGISQIGPENPENTILLLILGQVSLGQSLPTRNVPAIYNPEFCSKANFGNKTYYTRRTYYNSTCSTTNDKSSTWSKSHEYEKN